MRVLTADHLFLPGGFASGHYLHLADDGQVIALTDHAAGEEVEHFQGILCPGFVNAHCHLELSHLKGEIPQRTGLPGFVTELMGIRQKFSKEEKLEAIQQAEGEMLKAGIVAVGDISNEEISFPQKAKGNLRYHTFIECIGLRPEQAHAIFERAFELHKQCPTNGGNSKGFAPHAPYTASAELQRLIYTFEAAHSGLTTIHTAESEAENVFSRTGEGPFSELYQKLGLDTGWYQGTGQNSIRNIVSNQPQGVRLISVHNTYLSSEEIAWAEDQSSNLVFCFCPKANLYIEGQLPNLLHFMGQGCEIALGTDSLASNDSLSILAEMQVVASNFPSIKLGNLLTWATLNGAKALNFANSLGSFETGKKPGVLLLSGMRPEGKTTPEGWQVKRLA